MMRNTPDRFGLVSILLHWLIAITMLGLFGLGWYMVDLTYYDALYQTLPHWHKSIGILVGIAFLLRLAWRWISPPPAPVAGLTPFQRRAARWMHHALFALIALIVVSGYLISTADGSSIAVFNLFEVPASISGIDGQEDTAGWIHEYLAYLMIGLTLVHAGAALQHHFMKKDDTLRRMLGLK